MRDRFSKLTFHDTCQCKGKEIILFSINNYPVFKANIYISAFTSNFVFCRYIFISSLVLTFECSSLFVCLTNVFLVLYIFSQGIQECFGFVLWTNFMCAFKANEWGYGFLHISQFHSGQGMFGSGCLISI